MNGLMRIMTYKSGENVVEEQLIYRLDFAVRRLLLFQDLFDHLWRPNIITIKCQTKYIQTSAWSSAAASEVASLYRSLDLIFAVHGSPLYLHITMDAT